MEVNVRQLLDDYGGLCITDLVRLRMPRFDSSAWQDLALRRPTLRSMCLESADSGRNLGARWCSVDVSDAKEIDEVYELLNGTPALPCPKERRQ